MAKKITSGKRDREKLKEQKRQEKQKRKEDRQYGGKSSFEDMIAYVDENGILHSTPQDKPKEVIDASLIAVSVTKREDIEVVPLEGHVEFFNNSKGYGFVKDSAGIEKYFFHISSAPATIAEQDKVTFELERGERGMNAVKLEIIKKA